MPLRSGTDHTTPGPAKGARNKGLRPKQPKSAALLEQQRIATLIRDDDGPEDATDGTLAEEEGESLAQGGRESQTEGYAADHVFFPRRSMRFNVSRSLERVGARVSECSTCRTGSILQNGSKASGGHLPRPAERVGSA